MPRLISAMGRKAEFSDGGAGEFDCVIWCAGYRDDSTWVKIGGTSEGRGRFLHTAGRSQVKGLYITGRPWQRNRASALIMVADADAAIIARDVAARLGHAAGAGESPAG